MAVPELRFKEFTSDWSLKRIEEFSSKIGSGSTPLGGERAYIDNGIPFIRSQNVANNELNLDGIKFISESLNSKMSGTIVKKYDLLLNITGASIGRSCVVPNSFNIGNVNQHVCIIRLKDEHNPYFYQPYLASDRGQKMIMSTQVGGGREGLNFQAIRAFEIHAPGIDEQTKIANFLTAVDTKISQLTKKYELLTLYKKGVIQKIFNQELRFKDDEGREFVEWQRKLLQEIADTTTGSSNRVDSSLIGQYTFFDRSEDVRTSDKFLFDCEAIIVPGEGQAFHPKYFIGKFDLHQRAYAVKNFNGCIGKFIYFHIQHHSNYFLSKAVGSTVKSLRLPMFNEMPINLPCLEEQTKIANFLTAIDDKITNVKSQLEAAKEYKQGLLQQMFV